MRTQRLKTPAIIASGIIVLVAVTLSLPIQPSYVTDTDHVNKLKRQANLRTVPGYLHEYADEHGGVYAAPDEFMKIVEHFDMIYPLPLLGDDDQDEVWMCPIPWPDRRIPEEITQEELAALPMLHERIDLDSEGTSVAFWNGDVRLLSNEEFERLVDVEKSVCLGCQLPIPDFMKNREP